MPSRAQFDPTDETVPAWRPLNDVVQSVLRRVASADPAKFKVYRDPGSRPPGP